MQRAGSSTSLSGRTEAGTRAGASSTAAATTTTTTRLGGGGDGGGGNGSPATTVAAVHFKVRCEQLGHGEDIYLVPYVAPPNTVDSDADVTMAGETGAALSSTELLLQPPSPSSRHKVRGVLFYVLFYVLLVVFYYIILYF